MPEKYQTVAESSAQTGYSHEYIRALARSKTIASKKYGWSVMIDLASLLKYKKEKDAVRAAYKETKK